MFISQKLIKMTTLKEIRKHMLDYMSYVPTDDEIYDEDGHCGGELWNNVKGFWEYFNTDDDFRFVVSCQWVSDLDLDGGRDYILSSSKVTPLLFDYMYNTLGWRSKDYEKVIFNSTNLTEELEDMFDNIPVIRDTKIEEILKKEVDNVESCFENEDDYWSNMIIKFPMNRKSACDGQDNLTFVGYSKLDGNPIYKMNLPNGFEVIKSVNSYL